MGKKNSQIHLFLETDLIEALDVEANNKSISRSELIRKKLRECSQLTRVEILIEKLSKQVADFRKSKTRKSALRQ